MKTYYLENGCGGRGKIKSADAVAIENDHGEVIVRYSDGGWNHAEDCFFTAEQCRKYHKLPPEQWTLPIEKMADKLEDFVEDLRKLTDV